MVLKVLQNIVTMASLTRPTIATMSKEERNFIFAIQSLFSGKATEMFCRD